MRSLRIFISAWLIFIPGLLLGAQNTTTGFSADEVRNLIKTIFSDNHEYVSELHHTDFLSFREQQTPRATVLTCSDSRIQASAFHKSPVNDLFIIRNMGNQIQTTEGTIEYGIYHLHTPILLIIGHSYCGAVIAAMGDYQKESPAIKKELNHLHLHNTHNVNNAVLENVNNQVKYAMKKFKRQLANHELIVIGTVYDFRDDFGHGHGRLILINLNGETNPTLIRENALIKGFEDISIGSNK